LNSKKLEKPYSGHQGGVILLFAVVQRNKDKVRPVMDYRELNQLVFSHTADDEVCIGKLRARRRLSENVRIIDLRKAYLQIRVDPSLWHCQVVEHKGLIKATVTHAAGLWTKYGTKDNGGDTQE